MIRFLCRWFFRLLILAVVLATSLLLLKDLLVREWLEYRLRRVTGLETRLASARLGLAQGTITLEGLRLFNAAEFGGLLLLSVPELHVELDRQALFRRQLGLKLVRLHLVELNVVRSRDGSTNLVALLAAINERATPADAALLSPFGLGLGPGFAGVDTLNLSFDTLRFIDLRQPAANRELRIGLTNEILRHVKTTADFSPLLMRVLVNQVSTGLGSGPPRDGRSPLRP